MRIVLASGNKGKIKEIKNFFPKFEIVAYSDLIEPFEIIENGKTFKENAIIKSEAIFKKLPNDIILSDDSGISVPYLKGSPGIYSARFAGEDATDKDNLYKLIEELKSYKLKQTQAFYTSCIAITNKYGTFTTHGFMYGNVIDEARGSNGFGYDPMFIPDGFSQTLGELESDIKQELSHRSKALKLATKLLKSI